MSQFSFAQNIKSGLFWIGIFKFTGQFFIWANTIIIARYLNPADYGIVGMAALITDFILLIGNFGFGSSIIQKKDLQDIHIFSLFWITFLIGIFLSILIYLIAPLGASFFQNKQIIPILKLSAIALLFNILSDIPNSILLKDLKYKYAGISDFTSNLIASICVLIFVIMGHGAYSLVYGSIISGSIKFLLACMLGRWFPKLKFKQDGLRPFFKFGRSIVVSRVLWYLYSNSDYLILAKKLGQITFGYYSFAFNFACIPTNKLQPIIAPVLFSSFSKIQDDFLQIRKQFLKIVNFVFTFYGIIYCGIFWIIPEFVTIFLGSKWEPIIFVLQILLMVQPLRAVSNIAPSLINSLGKPEIGVKNMLVFIAIMIPSFLIGAVWGMIGVALMWCIAYPIAFFIVLLNNLRVAQIPLMDYLYQLLPGLRIIFTVSIILYVYKQLISVFSMIYPSYDIWIWVNFGGTIIVGFFANILFLWRFDVTFLRRLRNFIKK